MKVLPFSRSHRTALVIDVRRGITPDYENRVKRLLESVNGDNIKVDVFTLSGDGVLAQGTTLPSATKAATGSEVTLSPGSPFSVEAEAVKADSESVVIAELDAALDGYTQVLHVRNLDTL